MTEQTFINLTDKQVTVETPPVNSFIRRSISNKLDVPIISPLTSSSTDDDILAQSVTMTSTDEGHVSVEDIHKCIFTIDNDNDNDNDSFDDENETIAANSFYSTLSSAATSNYGLMPCPICFESSILQSASCCKFRCCNSCWSTHISTAINDGRIKITCVSNQCNKYLTREIIADLIRFDTTLYERYLKLYANANQNPRAKTCPRCSHLYSLDTQTSTDLKNSKKLNKKLPKQVQCSECSLVWCFRCSAPWHENLTCKQFIKGDKLLLKWINQKNEEQWNARKCPKCSSVIQRNGGCPHMTCSSCSCEFCYLCGRRYVKIPIVGQHHNKFSVLGCPYNFHPERPWLRRTIRGVVATGVVAVSPLIVVGAVTAAVTVLPSVGIYRFVKHIRARRYTRAAATHQLLEDREDLFDLNQEQERILTELRSHAERYALEARLRHSGLTQQLDTISTTEDDFPLSIFADMDVEHLFIEDEKVTSDFQTCPTTPAINVRQDHLNINHSSTEEHV